MKTSKEDFKLFQEECQKWIDGFELNNYDVIYHHKDSDKFDGAYNTGHSDYRADLYLSKDIEYLDGTNISKTQEIKDAAKHEIVHLLLKRLIINAMERFVNKSEITEAEEEVVRKLTNIIREE